MKFQTFSHVEDEISINFELESLTGISTDEWNGTVSIQISSFDGRSQSTQFYPGKIVTLTQIVTPFLRLRKCDFFGEKRISEK